MDLWFELAQLFGRPIAELRRVLSPREFLQWSVYRQQHGPIVMWQRGDWHAAQIVSAQVGCKLGECLLDFSPVESQTDEEIVNIARSFSGRSGGNAQKRSYTFDAHGRLVDVR